MRLPPQPELDWSDESPSARAFQDVYFSKAGGLAETEAVFLGGCGLPQAWAGRDRFAVCELGFGTGLNVLALWRAWKKTRSAHAKLHVSSIEAFPLARDDAARALARFPELAGLAGRLLAAWPVRAYAPQRIWFPDDGFSLTLFTGAAADVLAQLNGRFDAWFLDGFAPARNADMWSREVFAHVARLSAASARLASFTVAGEVRRGLEAAGFAVEKKPGFGAKRERLEARFRGVGAGGDACAPARVAVVGAGIAGAACAHALSLRGVETVVLDAARGPGAGASGNPAALVMPRLDRGGELAGFYLAAYFHAVATYQRLAAFEPCGVVQGSGSANADALRDLLADPPLPADWFAAYGEAGLHLRAGLARPHAALEAMLAPAEQLFEARVERLERSGQGWVLRAEGGRAMVKADAVVLACGAGLTRFEPAQFLPIALSMGQVEWGAGRAPAHALTRGSYVAPHAGGVLFGATFDALERGADERAEPSAEARARNLEALAVLAPDVAASVRSETLQSRVSVRATTPDRAPIMGRLPDAERWPEPHAAHLGRGGAGDALPWPAYEGVFVLGGLGARGFTTAPLLGEVLAGELFGEPALLAQAARNALDPARFLLRALRRR